MQPPYDRCALPPPPSFADDGDDLNPLAGVANLFDVAMVFALALMVALVAYLRLPAVLQQKDFTVITNPGQPDMEIVVKEGEEITRYEATDATGSGRGELLGQAYRLPDGRVVYVPADKEQNRRLNPPNERPAERPTERPASTEESP